MTHPNNHTAGPNLTVVTVAETPGQAKAENQSSRLPARFNLPRVARQLGTFLLVCVLSAAAYLAINRFLLQVVEVVGVSMSPTLQEKGHYLLNRWALLTQDPRHRDIVVLRDPEDQGISVKRVIAGEGDSVQFKNGKVFVNGRELAEPYLSRGTCTYVGSPGREKSVICGKDQYFVLGDNRPRSIDSRTYGPVPRQNILGLVMVR